MPVSCASIAQQVRDRGYCIVAGSSLPLPAERLAAREELMAAWSELPRDPYTAGAYRYRRHAALHFRPADNSCVLDRRQDYFQAADVNRLTGGIHRRFEQISIHHLRNPLLVALLELDIHVAELVCGATRDAWEVNIHFVRVVAKPAETGLPSPEGRHRDGFDFIALHHIQQQRIEGGVTSLYDTAGTLQERHRLENPFDSLFAEDARVTHDVSPIGATDGRVAYRDMLLTSYSACGPACQMADGEAIPP